MTKQELEQILLMLASQGFKVEWHDAQAETFLIRALPTRSAA